MSWWSGGRGGPFGWGGHGPRGGRPWWADAMGDPPPRAERGGVQHVGKLMQTFRMGAHRGRLSPATMRTIRLALDEALEKIHDALNKSDR